MVSLSSSFYQTFINIANTLLQTRTLTSCHAFWATHTPPLFDCLHRYKVAQLGFPTARNIVDVGANKGYLGSLFLSLWGGGDYGVSPAKLFELTTADGTWAGSKNPAGECHFHECSMIIDSCCIALRYTLTLSYSVCLSVCPSLSSPSSFTVHSLLFNIGYCKDGFNRGIPLTCATRDKQTGACSTHNPIHIYSFDGSSFLTNTMNQLITSKCVRYLSVL